ncbi:MAG TPA: hypothetical protein VLF88_03115 [Candidatus Babeliales bacterium]|nr:hypothetical protein [Candidatus Babeliales bacterium]
MQPRDGIGRTEAPRSEIRSYANEHGLKALAALVRIVVDGTVEISGRPIEACIAEELGHTEPDSDGSSAQVTDLLDRLSDVLPTAQQIEYVRPTSHLLEDDSAAEALTAAVEDS